MQNAPSDTPSSVHVGSMPGSTSSLCPVAGIISCSTVITSHIKQNIPSETPSSVQLGSIPGNTTSMCPDAGTTSCSSITFSHILQYLPSVKPSSVHVGSTAERVSNSWLHVSAKDNAGTQFTISIVIRNILNNLRFVPIILYLLPL